MALTSEIIFGDSALKKTFNGLDSGKSQDRQLKKHLESAFKVLENDAFAGIQIPKNLIPKSYEKKFGKLGNLWKYNLPDAWRLIYTIKRDEIVVLSIVLEWMPHKEYDRRFGY